MRLIIGARSEGGKMSAVWQFARPNGCVADVRIAA
jgi:hypothetical protein